MLEITLCRAIIRCKGRYLFLKRTQDIIRENLGKWECPGGKINPNEDRLEAIKSEIKEETGLNCNIVKELPFMSLKTKDIDSKCYVFLFETEEEDVKLSKDHSEFMWLKPDEVKYHDLVLFANLLLEYFHNEDYYLK